ncbi:MAG TPA: GvpL/GvpF family gas vesicle protein [Pyrinomonadaceae bacterium]
MNLYAYCLSDEVTAEMLEPLTGMADAKPRLLVGGKIAAIVSEFEGEAVTVTRENVLAHERVVRRVLMRATPLPFRFGTVVPEERLRNYLDSQQDSLLAQFMRVRGCVEMSVKVIWDLESVKEEAAGLNRQEGATESAGPVMGSGTEFLKTKRLEILGDEALKRRAAEVASWLAESLGETVRETRVTVQPKESLVLAAAHLVERGRLKEYRARLGRARAQRADLHFLTSGAWPPYSFTGISS